MERTTQKNNIFHKASEQFSLNLFKTGNAVAILRTTGKGKFEILQKRHNPTDSSCLLNDAYNKNIKSSQLGFDVFPQKTQRKQSRPLERSIAPFLQNFLDYGIQKKIAAGSDAAQTNCLTLFNA